MKSAKNGKSTPCPCGQGLYATCCEPLHQGLAAASAEALMRSRYSAYALQLADYLRDTWHADTRPADLAVDDHDTKWIGLVIRQQHTSGDNATVEFVARYKINGRAQRLHEISRFVREAGRWYYVNGQLLE